MFGLSEILFVPVLLSEKKMRKGKKNGEIFVNFWLLAFPDDYYGRCWMEKVVSE